MRKNHNKKNREEGKQKCNEYKNFFSQEKEDEKNFIYTIIDLYCMSIIAGHTPPFPDMDNIKITEKIIRHIIEQRMHKIKRSLSLI